MDNVAFEDGPGPDCQQEEGGSFSKHEELCLSASDLESSTGLIYQGPVYHIGVNRLGHHFCHLRFLRISGIYVEMFKKDPAGGTRPIRQGIAGRFLKVEDLGRRKVEDKDLYVLRISNSLENKTKGEMAFRTALDAQNWRDAFLQAKDEADAQFHGDKLMDKTDQFTLNGHRPRLRPYAKGLTKMVTIGRGSDYFLELEANGPQQSKKRLYASKQDDDTIDKYDWRCVRTVNGIRILEDTSSDLTDELVILKSVGVIEASPHAIFEMLMDIRHPCRKEWDILTGDLNLIEEVDGHCDIVYGTFDPKYLRRWNSKSDFVFSRVWRYDPDNTYSILQSSTVHTDCPKKSGFRRITLTPTFWEIKPLVSNEAGISKSRVTQTMEIRSTGWGRWKRKYFAKLDKTIPYVILCQIAGLRDHLAAKSDPDITVPQSRLSRNMHQATTVVEASEFTNATEEEFYDAIAAEVPEDEEGENEKEELSSKRETNHRFRTTVLAVMTVTPHARAEAKELVSDSNQVEINLSQFKGSLPQAATKESSGCWIDPGGEDFMVRGKSYPSDFRKVSGGEPLMKLLAVDWFYSESRIDSVATNHNHIVESEAGKRLPFILIINLQVPATPNYSLVFYFGGEKPICKGSLLDSFVNGSNAYRDSRFKLIPRIVKGYWFVKRAVGTKACLLGNAVTCRYLRQDNFFEIDVDIGSSSVARNIINLVLKHVTSLVVDMAILIEGKEAAELPEYLLGTTRVVEIRPKSAVLYQ